VTFWTAERVAAALDRPRRPGAGAGSSFTGVSTDTRSLRGGELFVALKGERFDAHGFLAEARVRGAAGAVVRTGTPAVAGLELFPVPDTLAALGSLARARRRALPVEAPVVAVTGSSGKTSTKELIRAALAPRWRVHATTGNLNNLVGVPLTILAAPDDAAALVVEAGASLPGEIAALRDIIEPTIAVVTNVGYAHVEGFGSLAAVLQEKVSLCDGVPVAVVGVEPPQLADLARRRARKTVTAGRLPPAEVRPDAAALDDRGQPAIRWAGASVTLAVLGLHQVDNAMIALAVAREAGVEPARAVPALAQAQLPPGRGGLVNVGRLTVLDDTYNANPSSLRASLDLARWIAQRAGRPLAVVVGSMLELGPESDRLHHAAARDIAAARPALVGAVGAFVPAFEALGAAGAGPARIVTAPDAAALGPKLKAALRGDEVVLLKASRGVALERVLRHLQTDGAT
jgi:UDP-N-acetylmuramoyl-tripeptide--D-alanyl-D-alanine ligase